MMSRYLPLILLGVLLNASAQLLLKEGMRLIGHFDFSLDNLFVVGPKVVTNLQIFLGMCCYGVSVVVWLMVLSRVDVSYAYPMLSVGYLVTAVTARLLFAKPVGLTRASGIVIICLGVFLLS